jgi:hypothetical protein
LRNVALLTPLGPTTEEEHNGLLHFDVVDAVSRTDINLKFPNAIATEAVASQVPGIDNTVDPTLYGNSSGDIANPIKPVLIDIVPAGIKVVQYLHSIFAYKRIRVKRGWGLVI